MMKNTRTYRIIAALLCALMLLPAVACGTEGTQTETTAAPTNTSAPAGETTASPETTAPSPYDENGFLLDTLDPTLDFNEETVTTLYWEDREWGGIVDLEFFVEEKNGENVNDALYKRNETVEDRLNINFEWIGTAGSGFNGGIENYLSMVRKSNDAGDLAYDMLGGYALSIGVCAQNGLLMDLNEVEHIDFEKPWWPEKLTEQAIIKDKLYFASGDISQSLIYMMYVCYFNKGLLEDYQLESPYDLVLNNEWTLSKVFEMATGVYEDINGNGVKDLGDQYGFYCNLLHGDAFLWGSGTNVIVNNGEEGLALNPEYSSERTQNILTQVCTFFFDTNDGYMHPKFGFEQVLEFVSGHALFYYDRLSTATRPDIRDNENLVYGIVPIPVYDKMQTSFSTYLGDQLVLYAVPLKQDDTELSGAVMECMASEGYRQVSPELFGVAMKVKYSKDEVTSQMLDIARDCITFDLGRIFHTSLDGLPTVTWQNAVAYNNPNWASTLKRNKTVMSRRIDNLNKAFE